MYLYMKTRKYCTHTSMFVIYRSSYTCKYVSAMLIIIEGNETAFNSFLVPVYNWKTVGKSETDPQLL